MHRIRALGGVLAALLALHLTLIATVEPLEWAVGATAALLATAAFAAARRAAGPPHRPATPPVRPAVALRLCAAWAADLFRDTAHLVRLIAARLRGRPVSGRFRRLPCHAVRPATGAVWLSTTPGAYTAGIDLRTRTLTVHLLPPGRPRLGTVLARRPR